MADVIIGSDGPAMSAEATSEGFKISKMDSEETFAQADGKVSEPSKEEPSKAAPKETEGKEGDEGDKKAEEADKPDFSDLKQPEKFDPEDADNLAAWDAEYMAEGDLNLERFQKEVSKNLAAEGGKAELDANTYEYLKAKGIGKKVVDQVIQDRLDALRAKEGDKVDQDFKVFDHIHAMKVSSSLDGSQVFREAIAWAAKGAYSEAAQERFNKVMDGQDLQDKLDAAELLVTKYQRSDAFKASEAERIKGSRKREPGRDATNARGTPAGASSETFATRAEWRAARKAAGNNQEAQRAVFKKAKASGFA